MQFIEPLKTELDHTRKLQDLHKIRYPAISSLHIKLLHWVGIYNWPEIAKEKKSNRNALRSFFRGISQNLEVGEAFLLMDYPDGTSEFRKLVTYPTDVQTFATRFVHRYDFGEDKTKTALIMWRYR